MPAKINVETPKTAPVEEPTPSQEQAHQSVIDSTRDQLRAQPKVQVRVHSDGDVPVQINGYTYLIQPNVKVSVPESVAILLDEAGYL
jgi:hypothetical protein